MNITMPANLISVPSKKDRFCRDPYSSFERRNVIDSFFTKEDLGYKITSTLLQEDTLKITCLDKIFKVNSRFSDLVDEINDSSYIPNLVEGWGDNGKVIDKSLYLSTIEFIINHGTYIYDNYYKVINTPEINPVRNGSIDIVWNTDNAYMLINIKPDRDQLLGTFFGFHKSNNKIKEGEIDVVNIEPSMAFWMKDL